MRMTPYTIVLGAAPAVAITADVLKCCKVTCQAHPTNGGIASVGTAGGQPFRLRLGDSCDLYPEYAGQVFVSTTTPGDVLGVMVYS